MISLPNISQEGHQAGNDLVGALRRLVTIRQWQPGQLIPTEAVLSRDFGVCRVTINKALKVLERDGLLVCRRGKGRFVSPPTLTARTHTIAVITIDMEKLTHPVQIQKLAGIQGVLQERNYHLNLIAVHYDAPLAESRVGLAPGWASLVDTSKVDGVIVLPGEAETDQVELLAQHLPVVWLDHATHDPRLAGVRLDFIGGAFQAGLHLAELGHRHIGLLWPERFSGKMQQLHDGLRLALSSHEPSVRVEVYGVNHFDESSGRAGADRVLAQTERPTALLCGSDEILNGCYRQLIAAGVRVPRDLSIISWNDHLEAADLPQHPTVLRMPYHAAGEACARRLLAMIEEQQAAHVVDDPLILPQLVLGETTGACPPRSLPS